mmetsp:Transcript_85985/g.242887  ORF Transcript_85985/g.242887 Transcript_85985/m.242887 type:complete len:98 (+) Transcript_85985:93-386(+)
MSRQRGDGRRRTYTEVEEWQEELKAGAGILLLLDEDGLASRPRLLELLDELEVVPMTKDLLETNACADAIKALKKAKKSADSAVGERVGLSGWACQL